MIHFDFDKSDFTMSNFTVLNPESIKFHDFD